MKQFKNLQQLSIETSGERFYPITHLVKEKIQEMLSGQESGVLHLFNPHTSCGLLVSESFDPSAAHDLENFLKHIAPRNLPFIAHTAEGPDDSPSHMKNLLLSPTLTLLVDQGEIVLGTWQGIYLCEFRDHKHQRKLFMKFHKD